MKNKKLNILFVLFLTVIVLYFALKDDYKEILALLMDAKMIWLVIAYLVVLSYTFLKSIVTNELINTFKPSKILDTFRLQLMTFFFNAVTPFSSGGQPFQVYVLRKEGLTLTKATNVVVQESMIHQIAFAIVIMIAVALNHYLKIYNLDYTMTFFISVGFIINLVIVLILLFLSCNKKISKKCISSMIKALSKIKIIKKPDQLIKKWHNRIDDFNAASKALLSNKKRFICMLFINIIAIICLHAVPFLVLYSLGNYTAFNGITAMVLVTFVSVVSSYVPLPGGSLGQEYLFTLFFMAYITNPLLSSVMILWRLITYYIPMIVGAIIFNVQTKLNN